MATFKKAAKKSAPKKSTKKVALKKSSPKRAVKKSALKKAVKKLTKKKSAPKKVNAKFLKANTFGSTISYQAFCSTENKNIGKRQSTQAAAEALGQAHKTGSASNHIVTIILGN